MPRKVMGLPYVAKYMGVSKQAVLLWMDSDAGFPEPDVEVIGANGKVSLVAWYETKLIPMRPWYNKRRGFTPRTAHEHWASIDHKLKGEGTQP